MVQVTGQPVVAAGTAAMDARAQHQASTQTHDRRVVTFQNTVVEVVREDGYYLASDSKGHTYGTGNSEADALRDWGVAIHERFELLESREADLAPRLARELAALRARFTWVGTNAAGTP